MVESGRKWEAVAQQVGGDWDQRLKQMNQMIPTTTGATPTKTEAAAIFASELPQHEIQASVLWAPNGRAERGTGSIAVPETEQIACFAAITQRAWTRRDD